MNDLPGNLTLALETAIGGGSISLLHGREEIDYWLGGEEFLKAKDFLLEIEKLLKRNKISRSRINRIAVATGPGSFTGIRIGISIALGLKTAWNCRISGINILEAIAFYNLNVRPIMKEFLEIFIPVLPFAKKDVCWQILPKSWLEKKALGREVRVSEPEEFMKFLSGLNNFALFANNTLFQNLETEKIMEDKTIIEINVGKNLARQVGFMAVETDVSDLAPIYVGR